MIDVLDGDGYFVSELPDLTRVSLEDLPAVSVSRGLCVLERAINHPDQDRQEQRT